jgi:sigma-E factor negative regulatory protein RseA
MTEPLKEQLSACLDGELGAGELDLLMKQVERGDELKATLGRYAAISAAMRSERIVRAPAGFAAKVSAAVAAETLTPVRAISSRRQARWLQPAAGFAVAAGVAAVAVLVLRTGNVATPAAEETIAAATIPAPIRATTPTLVAGPARSTPDSRLTNYVVAHSEFSSPLSRRVVLSGVLTQDTDTESLPTEESPATNASAPPSTPAQR